MITRNLEEQLHLLRKQVCEGGSCKATLADLPIDEQTSRAYLRSKLLTESTVGTAPVATQDEEDCGCSPDDVLLDRLAECIRDDRKRKALEAFLEAVG